MSRGSPNYLHQCLFSIVVGKIAKRDIHDSSCIQTSRHLLQIDELVNDALIINGGSPTGCLRSLVLSPRRAHKGERELLLQLKHARHAAIGTYIPIGIRASPTSPFTEKANVMSSGQNVSLNSVSNLEKSLELTSHRWTMHKAQCRMHISRAVANEVSCSSVR